MGALLTVIAGTVAYSQLWSAPAKAEKTGAAFLISATEGDQAGVQSLLAGDARITAAETIALYSGLSRASVSDVIEALPNHTGVEYVVLASGAYEDGYTETTTLLLRRQDNRWVVVDAGENVRY